MLDMLENIISAPIFFQVPMVALQMAVLLYQIEHVSAHFLRV